MICYWGVYFSGDFNKEVSELKSASSRRTTGYVIWNTYFLIVYSSKLKIEKTVTTTESEDNTLAQALSEMITHIGHFEKSNCTFLKLSGIFSLSGFWR